MPLRSKKASLGVAFSLTAAALTIAPGLTAASYAAPPTSPFISEIHYDDFSTDVDEFVEVQLPPGTSSSGLQVVLYNGNGGASYATYPVPAATAPTDAAAVAVVNVPVSPGIQNGSPDGIALVQSGTVLEFLSYEGPMSATNGPASGLTSTDIGVSEESVTEGQSLSRVYDSTTGVLSWKSSAPNTRGAVNPTVTSEPAGPKPCEIEQSTAIGAVQGPGAATPMAGDLVTVRGVVVGDVPSYKGFYLQDAGDGSSATSDGIFIFSEGTQVDAGDTVAVTGRASDRFGQTQISADDAQVCTEGDVSDLPAPAALDLPATDAEREPFEGMLVEPVDTLTVSEVFALTSYGELMLSEGGLLVQPTELARPGTPEAAAIAEQNVSRRIVLDDGSDYRTSNTSRPYLSPTTPVRVGDELDFTEPLALGFAYGKWRLQPADGTADGVFAAQNTRTATPGEVGGDVQVGAFNVLNYFLTTAANGGRGATSQAQLDKQAGKIVPAILALGADVVTLMEIEDTDSTGYDDKKAGAPVRNADLALADLVGRLNAQAEGDEEWAYVPLPDELYAVKRDAIRSAIIYKPGVVEPVGDPVGLVDEDVWFNAREPIAQTFKAEDDVFTVVANHLKSKGSGDTATGDNTDPGDGEGAWNGDRVRQAASLATFVEELKVETEDDDVLLLGDFNAYTMEDPIQKLRDAGFVDLGQRFDADHYSYVYDEMSGSLDHALATQPLTEKVTDLVHWNINAVESYAYQYVGDPALYAPIPYRSSDHDPLVLGLDLQAPRDEDYLCNGLVPTIVGTNGDDVLAGTEEPDVIMALGGDDEVSGLQAQDTVCAGSGDDEVSGGNGDDALFGGSGDDVLRGGNGDDRLVGGLGVDDLQQGRGTGPVVQEGRSS